MWKIARVLKCAVENGKTFVYFTVAGESKEFRKTSNELKNMSIGQDTGTEFEVTLKMGDKGSMKIDQYRKKSAIQTHQTNNHPATQSPPQAKNQILPNNPYAFLPIDLANTVLDVPIWHDGSSPEKTYSGELHCTLTALTPLLVGNQRFTVGDAIKDALPAGIENVGKAILEPLRLQDGRVLLPGSSLKGMVRQQLAILLNAPMDNVTEHHYTYRPNLDFLKAHELKAHERRKYDVRPAIVAKINSEEICVKLLPAVDKVIFCSSEVESVLKPDQSIEQLENADWKTNWKKNKKGEQEEKVDYSRIQLKKGNTLDLKQTYKVFKYVGGIDGEGKFAKAFKGGKVHGLALVAESSIPADETPVPPAVYQAYKKTQQILADDKEGHLNGHPLHKDFSGDVAQAIKNATALQGDQLIYVEVELNEKGIPISISSMGHHFRYRWAYTDSIRYRNAIQPQHKTLRSQLNAAAQELNGQLNGAHLLFGYAGEKRQFDGQSIDKLAGRIAINHAVSEVNPRFLNQEQNHWVFLNILGQPKASAVEHYLEPNPKHSLMQTYGDLPGQEGGKLAGRKVYRHQKNAATLPRYQAPSEDVRNSDQSTLARYVSAPGSQFKFTLRFARLRDWELGALIAALNPERLKDNAKVDDYALKLGYGRPLGLGSVKIVIDACLLENQPLVEQETAFTPWVSAAKDKLSSSTIDKWLAMLSYQRNDDLAYPTLQNTRNSSETTIYNYHTDIRKTHSKNRRKV